MVVALALRSQLHIEAQEHHTLAAQYNRQVNGAGPGIAVPGHASR